MKNIQELDALGVKFLAVTPEHRHGEKQPDGRFMLTIMSVFAELEKELVRETTVAGVRNARERRNFVFFSAATALPSLRKHAAGLSGWGIGVPDVRT